MSDHAVTPISRLRLLATVVLTVAAAASPAGAGASAVEPQPSHSSEHNACVAEYLLLQYLASAERNARVAEWMAQGARGD